MDTIKELIEVLSELNPNTPLIKKHKLITGMYHIDETGYNWGPCFGYDRGSKRYGCCEAMRQRRKDDNPVFAVSIE